MTEITPLEEKEEAKGSKIKAQIISSIVLVVILITIWHMLDLVLLTFLVTFLLYHLVTIIQRRFKNVTGFNVPVLPILICVYILLFALLSLIGLELLPRLTERFYELSVVILSFDVQSLIAALDPRLTALVENTNIDLGQFVTEMGGIISGAATRIGHFSLNIFFALILGFVLILEKGNLQKFGERLGRSKVSFIYEYFIVYGGTFAKTFGKVMKVQVIIAFFNMILSSIFLFLMGFPNIPGLAVMIFCLGLIPVAGVIISLIPLSAIAFTIGGIFKVLQLLIMIIVVHAFEAYFLNPKLMASKTRLPVCLVFIVLFVGEHYMGVWGLLIGIPFFVFLLTVLEVDYAMEKKPHRFSKRKKPQDA